MLRKMTLLLFSLTGMFVFMGCGSTGDTEMIPTAAFQPKVSVVLKDAPSLVDAVYVTIDEIRLHKQGSCPSDEEPIIAEQNVSDVNISQGIDACSDDGWMTIVTPRKTIDLLTLQNGTTLVLGDGSVEAGIYTQLRMVLGMHDDNTTNHQGETHPYAHYLLYTEESTQEVAELKVPSSQIIVNHQFEVNATQSYEITIDFDANQSIHQAGNSGQWILTPVLRVVGTHLIGVDKNETTSTEDVEDNDTVEEEGNKTLVDQIISIL